MKRNQGDTPTNRDAGAATPATDSAVGWMTNAGIEDCRNTAASAPLWALVEAHRWLQNRENQKTRSKIVAGAMKRRFKVMAGSDETLTAAKGGANS